MIGPQGAENACGPAPKQMHFALFPIADLDPEKTPPSHMFIDLNAIKSIAKHF